MLPSMSCQESTGAGSSARTGGAHYATPDAAKPLGRKLAVRRTTEHVVHDAGSKIHPSRPKKRGYLHPSSLRRGGGQARALWAITIARALGANAYRLLGGRASFGTAAARHFIKGKRRGAGDVADDGQRHAIQREQEKHRADAPVGDAADDRLQVGAEFRQSQTGSLDSRAESKWPTPTRR